MKRICLTIGLEDDPALIAEYEQWHTQVWPEVVDSIKDSGVSQMEIYRFGNVLIMIMEVKHDFNLEEKAQIDATNEKVQEWEQIMSKYQKPFPQAKPGEKWALMNKIFDLTEIKEYNNEIAE